MKGLSVFKSILVLDELMSVISRELPSPGCLGLQGKGKTKNPHSALRGMSFTPLPYLNEPALQLETLRNVDAFIKMTGMICSMKTRMAI